MQSGKFPDAEVERTTQRVFINDQDITPIVKSYNVKGGYVRIYVMIGLDHVRTKGGKRLLIKIIGDIYVI